jgi:urease alpha subunit
MTTSGLNITKHTSLTLSNSEKVIAVGDVAKWIENIICTEGAYTFSITLRQPEETCNTIESGIEVIGTVGTQSATGPVSYNMHPSFWGQGYATEALEAFSNWLLRGHGDKRELKALTDKENTASARVLEKVGFWVSNPSVKGRKNPEKEWVLWAFSMNGKHCITSA